MGAKDYGASSGIEEESGERQQFLSKNEGNTSQDYYVGVPAARVGFNYGNRPCRDVAFAIVFLTFITASIGFGLFAYFNENSEELGLVEPARFDQSCAVSSGYHGGMSNSEYSGSRSVVRHLLGSDAEAEEKGPTGKSVLYVVLSTVIMSVVLAAGLLWTLRKYTLELVYITIPFIAILPVVIYVTFFVECFKSESCKESFDFRWQVGIALFVVLVNVLFVTILCKNWDRVELSIRIIQTASEALHNNLGLLGVLPTLNLVYCLYLAPAACFLYWAYTNGRIVANPELEKSPGLKCGKASDVSCCVWEVDGWVPFYIALTGFTMLWGIMVVGSIHVYSISGTISQWYFAPAQTSTLGTTKRSLRNAMGPSFGTLCFSGLVGAIVQLLRSAVESSRQNRGSGGIAAIIVRECLKYLLSAIEFITKFTTIFAAVSGEDFCSSARLTFDLLTRNLLSTVVVESITGRLLLQAILFTSAAYGLLVWGVMCVFMWDRHHLWSVALLAGAMVLVILFYASQILHTVIDTVYICYAMDKDSDEVSKQEVHDVYVLLPASQDGTASVAYRQSNGE